MPSGTPATAVIDFGASFTDEASVAITGLTDMTTSAHVEFFMQPDDTTADNSATFHDALAFVIKRLDPINLVAGTGFTARARLGNGFAKGTFTFHYVYKI